MQPSLQNAWLLALIAASVRFPVRRYWTSATRAAGASGHLPTTAATAGPFGGGFHQQRRCIIFVLVLLVLSLGAAAQNDGHAKAKSAAQAKVAKQW